jgi:hypothetical protein
MTNHEDHHYPCVWPECPRSYDPCTGPEDDGWVRLFSGHLCPDHTNTGHTPQRFEWERGAPTLAMSCECGIRVEDLSPTTRARCVQWWCEHIRSAVKQRDEPVITDRLHPDWDGKKVFESARDKARGTLGREHPISGLLAHAAHDYGTDRWFDWRWPVCENVGRIAEMMVTGDLLPTLCIDDGAVERTARSLAAHYDCGCFLPDNDYDNPGLCNQRNYYRDMARAAITALMNPNIEENNHG